MKNTLRSINLAKSYHYFLIIETKCTYWLISLDRLNLFRCLAESQDPKWKLSLLPLNPLDKVPSDIEVKTAKGRGARGAEAGKGGGMGALPPSTRIFLAMPPWFEKGKTGGHVKKEGKTDKNVTIYQNFGHFYNLGGGGTKICNLYGIQPPPDFWIHPFVSGGLK